MSMISIYDIYHVLFKFWRRRRLALFLDLIRPSGSETMLDVGGYPGSWIERPQPVQRIDILNIHEIDFDSDEYPDHAISTLVGDGCALEFDDGSYDIVFSNSVIEHVGSWEKQQEFAAELRRVGGALWVQTPAYECPIEPHFLAPAVHWLPRSVRRFVVRWLTPWGWLQRPTREELERMVDEIRLLTRSEVLSLFPDCEILTERLLWVLPKSYVAVRRARS